MHFLHVSLQIILFNIILEIIFLTDVFIQTLILEKEDIEQLPEIHRAKCII